ncbi:MAG: hypothetical protein EOP01_07220 [Propionibacteriaceae bacterium]|nr:MAG: hypothetical protein EOP01_07220 [Propionibacteriaceae bacterium]
MLDRDLIRGVPSALGATVTLHRGSRQPTGGRRRGSHRGAEEIHATLGVSLRAQDSMFSVSITPDAGRACAFVDLAVDLFVDLADALGVPLDPRPARPDHPVEPGTSERTAFTLVNVALVNAALVNFALGHLLHRGRSLAAARAELAVLAEHHDADLVGAARQILDTGDH